MRFAVLYSKKDLAGINIAQHLKKIFLPQIPIIELKKESIYEDNIDKIPELKNTDFIIFATKHRSEKERKTLSLHAPGNWRSAELGGKSGGVCLTSALVLKYLFQELIKNNNSDYEVTLECTHHGPYIEKPCCFIEIGSTENQWQDKQPAQIIAKTLASLQQFKKQKYKIAIGMGGPHYCPNFNKIQLSEKSKIAISHIIPEYNLPLTKPMLEQAIQKTKEPINLFLIDWKGCGISQQRQQIINLLEQLNLKYKKTSEIEK